jgi:hypothetical protein
MSISRRKFLGFLTVLASGFSFSRPANARSHAPQRKFMGHQLHDDVSVSLLTLYARSLALKNPKERWEAQMMFHQAQLSREGGGTRPMKLGSIHKSYLREVESGRHHDGRSLSYWY